MLSEDKKHELIKTLSERLGQFECPMCHQRQFTVIDGYFVPSLLSEYSSPALSTSGIPMAGIVCIHCGFVSFHALGAIGLLNKQTK